MFFYLPNTSWFFFEHDNGLTKTQRVLATVIHTDPDRCHRGCTLTHRRQKGMEVLSQTAGSNPDPASCKECDLEHVLTIVGP